MWIADHLLMFGCVVGVFIIGYYLKDLGDESDLTEPSSIGDHTEVQGMEIEIAALQTQVNVLQEGLTTMRSEIVELVKQIKYLSTQIDIADDLHIATRTAHIESLQRSLRNIDESFSNMEEVQKLLVRFTRAMSNDDDELRIEQLQQLKRDLERIDQSMEPPK